MSIIDRTDDVAERVATSGRSEPQVGRFVSDALRAGERVIVVTCRGKGPARVPDTALVAGLGASRALHIRPPLPDPPELQQMICRAIGIPGGREIAPLEMAGQLLLASSKRAVVVAIDEAQTLSNRSLLYLTMLIELLPPNASVLQVVLAARPVLLETLARPEFEGLRNRVFGPERETGAILRKGRETALRDAPKRDEERASIGFTDFPEFGSLAASSRDVGMSRPTIYAAAGIALTACVVAIVYIAWQAFHASPLSWPVALERPEPSRTATERDPAQSLAAIDSLIDQLADAVASGSAASVAANLQRIAEFEAGPSPDGGKTAGAVPARIVARARAAAAAGQAEEAQRLGQVLSLAFPDEAARDQLAGSNAGPQSPPRPATPGAPPETSSASHIAKNPGVAPGYPAPSAEAQGGVAASAREPDPPRNGDRGVANPAGPAPRSAPPDQTFAYAPLSKPANAAQSPDVTGLPPLAPIRVVLNVASEGSTRGRRAAEIRQALTTAGLEVADAAPADARRQGPTIGYYFRSDRDAAAHVGRILAPVLGVVTPVALDSRGGPPEPGTIEIAVP